MKNNELTELLEFTKTLIKKNLKKKSLTIDVMYFYLDSLKNKSEQELLELNSQLFDELENMGYAVNRERKKIYWNVSTEEQVNGKKEKKISG